MKLNEKKKKLWSTLYCNVSKRGRAEGEEVVGKADKYCVKHYRILPNTIEHHLFTIMTFFFIFLLQGKGIKISGRERKRMMVKTERKYHKPG